MPLTWPRAKPLLALVHTEQPLTSVKAFVLALVEASSHLGASTAANNLGDADGLAVPRDDDAVATAE